MLPMRVFELQWDPDDDQNGNVQHLGRHGVSKLEVEEVFANPLAFDRSRSSNRPVVFGQTRAGRHLIVVVEEIAPDVARPITAYDVPKKKTP